MLEQERLEALLKLLTEMTLCSRKPRVPSFSRRAERVENTLLTVFAGSMILTVLVAVGYWYGGGAPDGEIPKLVDQFYLFGVLIAVLYVISALIHITYLIFRVHKRRASPILTRLERDLSADAAFIKQLQTFDRPTLEYALSQYRHHWESANGRVTLMAGEIRKVGLFPALVAASMAASTLLKEDGNLLLWAPLILACCFYLLGTMVLSRTERSGQVIKLLEYAISQHHQSLPAQNTTARDHSENSEPTEATPSKAPQKPGALSQVQERDPAPHKPNQ
ncbi:hypothetical protein [Alloalcanivorax xenomutans]|uniref:hypothetical protein n=1 Tax=Alloalcanivorax xenomutans TaxID=1094342 RepID=UPI003BAB3B50